MFPKVKAWLTAHPVASHVLTSVLTAAITIGLTYVGVPANVAGPIANLPAVLVAAKQSPSESVSVSMTEHACGWTDDKAEVERVVARAAIPKFSTTPAGKAALAGGTEAYLWQAVRKAAGKAAPWYPNVNQLQVGCCVGCGWKHSIDVVQATGIVIAGVPAEWRPAAVEVTYGLSRVEIGGGRMRGDGSVGAWAADASRTFGFVAMDKYADDDLTTFSPTKARQYGQRGGMPQSFETLSKQHPVKQTAQVKTWADVQKAVLQGYPVAVCSSTGFENSDGSPGTRDKDGFCAARGTWPHCMAFIAVRGGARPGAFCLNSWGDTAHSGPVFPDDQPVAGFWVDSSTVETMVSGGDSFALSDVVGFPARNLDWFAILPKKPLHNVTETYYALAH